MIRVPAAVVVLVLALAGALVPVGPGAQAAGGQGYVQRRGAAFVLDGRPLRLVGYNNYRLTSMPGRYECGGPVSDAELAQILDAAKNSGANVVRSWFFQSYARAGTADRWAAFDRLLDAAAARGMKVIPVLVNHWEACDNSPLKTGDFFASGYRQPNTYGNPQSYRAYATDIAAHYAGNRTVAFWQLANEAETEPACGADGAAILRAFADDMTRTVKAADPQHLVSLGTLGSGQCGAQGGQYRQVHAGEVDLCEYHDYDAPAAPLPGDEDNGLLARINQCEALGKPFVIGESGIYADIGPAGERTGAVADETLQARAGFFERKISAQLAEGVDGFLVWSIGRASNDGYDVDAGDPTLGVLRRFAGTPFPVPPPEPPPVPPPLPHPPAPARVAPPAPRPAAPPGPPANRQPGWRPAWQAARIALSGTGALAVQGRHSLGLAWRQR